MRIGDAGQHPPDVAELARRSGSFLPGDGGTGFRGDRGSRAGPGQQAGQRTPVRDDPVRLGERLPDQAPGPQREPSRQVRVGRDRRADPGDHELRVPRVGQNPQHEIAGLRVDQFRDRPVEVRRDPIPHVGLDQALEPVSRGGAGVEGIQRRGERQHRLLRLGAQRRQLVAQQPEVAELGGRHPGQGGLVGERGGERRVLGQPEVGVQFRVGQQAEQVDDPLIGGPPLRAWLAAAAKPAGLAGRIVAPLCFGHPRSVTTLAPRVGQPAGQDTLVHCKSELGMECGNLLPCSPSSRARGQPSRESDGDGRTRRWQDPAARPPAQGWPDALLRWRARPAGGADSQVRSGRDTRLGRAQTAGH